MSTTSLTLRHVTALAPVLVLSLACLAPVDGERAASGECPSGERCSAATPDGLVFVGQAFYDGASVVRLGPIVSGGAFDVGLQFTGDTPVPAFRGATTDAAVFSAVAGEGTFGPISDTGEPMYAVDDYVTLRAGASGEAFLRILDPATGELFDRMSFLVVDVRDVALENATAPARDHLLGGCDQMVGVRVLAEEDGIEVRAFDDAMRVWADGVELTPEPLFWDCVAVTPAVSASEMRFDVEVGGALHQRTFAVHTLASEGLAACPARRD